MILKPTQVPPTIDNNQYLLSLEFKQNNNRDNFLKFALFEAYISTHNFHIICLSETFLDSSLSDDDLRMSLKVYSLIRSDHPNNIKQ